MLKDNGYQLFIELVQDEFHPRDGSYVFAGLEATDDEIHDFVACILRSHNPFIESLDFHSIIVILLRIYAAYLRIQENHIIALSEEFIRELDDEPFFREAQELTDRLSNHYHMVIPAVETRYLQLYFLAMQNTQSINESDRQEASELCETASVFMERTAGHCIHRGRRPPQVDLCPPVSFHHPLPSRHSQRKSADAADQRTCIIH